MKKSNNKRTKRLRLKYKKTKTKRNIKRRTLRKTRRSHRQRGGLPTTTISPSTLSFGRLILNDVLSAMRQRAHRVGTETGKVFEKTLTEKSVKPFTIGHHTAAQHVTPTPFITELMEILKNKIKNKGVKTILENCMPSGNEAEEELVAESVRSTIYKKPNAAASVSSTLKRQTPHSIKKNPIDISEAQLKEDIGIKINSSDKEVRAAIDNFFKAIIADKKSHCILRPLNEEDEENEED